MLRTNNKKVTEKIKKQILISFKKWTSENEELQPFIYNIETFEEAKIIIIKKFILEMLNNENTKKYYNYNTFKAFKDWMEGLITIIDTSYFTKPIAKKIIIELLEETEEEAKRFTEDQAEELITKLYYNVLFKNISCYDVFNVHIKLSDLYTYTI